MVCRHCGERLWVGELLNRLTRRIAELEMRERPVPRKVKEMLR
jgi:hypothetical protein